MTKPKYGKALTRSEVAKISNAVRWKDQASKLAKAISEKFCQDCTKAITFKKTPTWKQLRERKRCYECHSRFLSIKGSLKRMEQSGDGRGYTNVWDGNKKKRLHIKLAEAVLGRELKQGEMVHHINGRRSDNRPNNLLICTIGYHNELHWRMRKRYIAEHPEFTGTVFEADKLYMEEKFGHL